MKKEISWILAIATALYLSILQLIMGSTDPLESHVNTGSQTYPIQLTRSCTSDADCPLTFSIPDILITGYILYSSTPDAESKIRIDLKREGDRLVGFLPKQAPMEKIYYQVSFEREKKPLPVLEEKPVSLKFKAKVPVSLILLNGFMVFLVLLLSSLTGFFALFGVKSYRWIIYFTLAAFLALSLFIYPLIQRYSLNLFWSNLRNWNLHSKIISSAFIWLIITIFSIRKNYRLLPVLAAVGCGAIFMISQQGPGEEPVKITLHVLERNFISLVQLF